MVTINFLLLVLITMALCLRMVYVYYSKKIIDQKEQIARLEKLVNSLERKLRENKRKNYQSL